ncbi:hypothetical protein HY989_03190 [Candidatus Micrarchaeota archaeon]|nr:hypothetical protein [Candidatus Micrarchaeota archaeon]
MAEIFISKIRPIGTSLGIIIPNEILKEEKLVSGNDVKFTIIKQDFKLLERMFGSAKNAKEFSREKQDRY